MKTLTFKPYKEDEVRPESVKMWFLLWQAINNAQWSFGGDRAKLRRMMKLLDAYDKITETVALDGNSTRYNLKKAGGDLVLEDAEFELLKEGWDVFSRQMPGSAARDILQVDEFLTPTIPG